MLAKGVRDTEPIIYVQYNRIVQAYSTRKPEYQREKLTNKEEAFQFISIVQ